MPSLERHRVIYHGRVQGVGFRATVATLASAFPVSGSVKNLPDGAVELIAEGERPTIDAFLAAIQAEFGPNIHDVTSHVEKIEKESILGFSIAY